MNEPYIDPTGPSLGSLTIYTKKFDRNNVASVTPKWQLYNHQGPDWKFAQTYIDEVNYTVKSNIRCSNTNTLWTVYN